MNGPCRIILAAVIGAAATGYALHSHGESNPELKHISEELRNGHITKIVIHAINPKVESPVTMSPETLLHHNDFSVDIYKPDFRDALADELDLIATTNSPRGGDVRWGCMFYDNNGREAGAIFIDRFGERGYINGQGTSFSTNSIHTNLAAWIEANLPDAQEN